MLVKLKTSTGNTLLRSYGKVDITDTLIKLFNSTGEYVAINFDKGIATSIVCAEDSQNSTQPNITKIPCVYAEIEHYGIILHVTTQEQLADLLGEKQTTELLKAKFNTKTAQQALIKNKQPQKDSRNLKELVKARNNVKPDANKQKVLKALYKANAKGEYQSLLKSGCDLKDLIIVDESANGLLVKFKGSVAEMLIDDPDAIAAIKAFQ
jgi:hypothetical protein